ncbi:unnamed protein product, partial [Prorocentrum cordatum]
MNLPAHVRALQNAPPQVARGSFSSRPRARRWPWGQAWRTAARVHGALRPASGRWSPARCPASRPPEEPRAVPGGSRRDVGPPWEGGPPRRAGGADPPGCRGVWRSRRWGRVSSSRTARARRVPPGPRTVGPSKSP